MADGEEADATIDTQPEGMADEGSPSPGEVADTQPEVGPDTSTTDAMGEEVGKCQ